MHEDFDSSTIARVTMTQYLNGPTVACKYSSEFRGLVYKVNPHDLSCVYKRMFELCATNALRDLEASEFFKKMATEFAFLDQKSSPEPDRPRQSKSMTTRLSLLADASSTSLNLLSAETHVQTKHINGWETCQRPHSSLSFVDHKSHGADGLKKDIKSRSLSALGKLECGAKEERIRHTRTYSTQCRKATSSEVIGNKVAEASPSGTSGHSCCSHTYSFTQIPYRFKHHQDLDEYMEQYRESYTYKRLETMRPNLSEMRPYQLSLPVSPLLRCFDMFGCIQPPPGIPRMSISRLQAAGFSPSGRLSPKRQIKKKIMKSPSPDLRAQRQTSSVIAAENGILKMEFQGQPLPQVLQTTIGQTTSPPSRKSVTNVYSTPSLSSVTVNNIKIPVVCRTRPTIPSNAHGAIYASSTETPTYVVSYHKNK